MGKIVGIGIIGLGNIAGNHINSILEIDGAQLKAVASSSEEKRRMAENNYGVRAFENYREMVQFSEVEVVIICTPSGFHLEPALAAAAAGKHVIVEKPLEITVPRSRQMIEACRKAKVKLACIFQNRYGEDFKKIEEAVRSGWLGKPVLGNAYIKWFRSQDYYNSASWRGTKDGDGGAALINQSIHTLDLLLHLMGPVKSVYGQIKTLTHQIEGEDLGVGIIEFENGALGTLEGSTSIFGGFPERLEIHGDMGSMVLEAGRLIYENTKRSGQKATRETGTASGSSDPMAIGYRLHKKQLEDVLQCIRENVDPPVSGEQALIPLQVIEAIYRSSASGEKVFL